MQQIYMDYGASTPVDPQVLEAMLPYFGQLYGNPASTHHHGRLAGQGLDQARRTVADLLNARPGRSSSLAAAQKAITWPCVG